MCTINKGKNRKILCYFAFSLLFLSFFLSTKVSASNGVSNGVSNQSREMDTNLRLYKEEGEGGVCEEIYGFVPCSKTAAGNLFLIVGYGYLMYLATSYLSTGSELLLEIMGPGFVSGCFLRLLGSFPDALLVLVSGIYGSTATAEDKVSVGMGLMAGSTVMRLTLLWGTCVLVGKCDLQGSQAVDETDTKGFDDLTGSGVSTDKWTNYAAWIMAISVVPLFIVQYPQAFNSTTSRRHFAVLIALIISILLLISYCLYEVFQPWMQNRWIHYVKHKRVMTGFLKHLRNHALGRLCNHDGTPNIEVMKKLFNAIDDDGDNTLCKREIKAFVIGIQFEGINLCDEDIVDKIMTEFDTEHPDGKIDLDEFIIGISRLLSLVSRKKDSLHNADTIKHLDEYDEEAKMEHSLLGGIREEKGEEVENQIQVVFKAIMLVVLGTIIAGVFAEPLIDVFQNFSDATGIPMFYLSFIVLPLATNSGEAISAIMFMSKKKKRSTSLALSELYGVVTVDNLLCLIAFLAVVYVRALAWEFSAEMFIIFLVFIIMGAFGSFRTVFPLWIAYFAFLLYPFLLVVVYLLKYVFGWS